MRCLFVLPVVFFITCSQATKQNGGPIGVNDSLTLVKMVNEREAAMSRKDLKTVVEQFDSLATFINGGGFYYDGIDEIKDFHRSMFENDSLTYTFKTGKPLVNAIRDNVAIVYYPWQQQW